MFFVIRKAKNKLNEKDIYYHQHAMFFYETMTQIKLPQPSVKGSIDQMVGLTEVEVSYTHPAKRGRKIFGGLVPYNRVVVQEPMKTQLSPSVKISLLKGKYFPKGNTPSIQNPKQTNGLSTSIRKMITGVFLNNGTKTKSPYKPKQNLFLTLWKLST